jgi:hypothetical protein
MVFAPHLLPAGVPLDVETLSQKAEVERLILVTTDLLDGCQPVFSQGAIGFSGMVISIESIGFNAWCRLPSSHPAY